MRPRGSVTALEGGSPGTGARGAGAGRGEHGHNRQARQNSATTPITGWYLKQYAIQAKPTNTERTTPSNNITMFMVLILLPTCSPANSVANPKF